jgi:dolichyl-phosphate beta-glucosyltransferase
MIGCSRKDKPGVNLSIVVPVYNETARLAPTLERLRAYAEARPETCEVLVVDDGSTDNSGQLVEEICGGSPAVRLLRNAVNSGKGFAVRTGVLQARGDYVLFSDADLSTPIEEAERLLEPLQGGYDVAIGSRALKPEWVHPRQPWARETGGKAFNFFVRALTGLEFRDTQCGFKAFRREAAQEIFPRLTIPGFGFDVEILYLARKLGCRALEVPVHWANDPRTKVRPFRDGGRMLGDLARIRWKDWRGKYGQ